MGREGRTVPEGSGASSFVLPRSRESRAWHRWACSARHRPLEPQWQPGFHLRGGEVLSQPAGIIRTLGLDAAGDIFVLPSHREFSSGGQLDFGFTPATITVSSRGGIGLGNDGVFLSMGHSVLGEAAFINRSDTDAQVQRFNAHGSLDTTFNHPPFDYGSQEAGRDGAAAVAIQSNGQMVTVGGHFFGTEPSGVARINTNGSLDPGFGNGGTVTTTFPGGFGYTAVVIQSDGKIVAVGGATDPTTGLTDLTLGRYLGT
jgi:uncharacterized delta-60 repeat protein